MFIDNATAHPQYQSCTVFFFAGDERVEEFRLQILRDADEG